MKQRYVYGSITVVTLAVVAWFAYQAYVQSTQPTLYGTWQGTITLDSGQQLTIQLVFHEAGMQNSQASGSASGELTLQGQPWGDDPKTLWFSGALEVSAKRHKITIIAQPRVLETDGAALKVIMQAEWRGNRLEEGLVALDVPGTDRTEMGTWQAGKTGE